MQEEREGPSVISFRTRVMVFRWYTIQEEEESVQVEYHNGEGRRCPAGIPCRRRVWVFWRQTI
jgi:hypothetical protein